MPKRGEIRLLTSLAHIREALSWIGGHGRMKSMTFRTILGSDEAEYEESKKLQMAFERRLRKVLCRKRQKVKKQLTINVPREEAVGFKNRLNGLLVGARFYDTRWRELAIVDDINSSMRARGRPKLTNAQRTERLSKEYHIGDRQKPRIRKAQKIALRNAEYSRGLRLRGETILTDTGGPPKI